MATIIGIVLLVVGLYLVGFFFGLLPNPNRLGIKDTMLYDPDNSDPTKPDRHPIYLYDILAMVGLVLVGVGGLILYLK